MAWHAPHICRGSEGRGHFFHHSGGLRSVAEEIPSNFDEYKRSGPSHGPKTTPRSTHAAPRFFESCIIALVARVAGRIARRDLARSFDAWLHGAAETVSARRNETRAVFFRGAFKTKAAFATWRATASSEARSRRLTKRAAYRFARRGSASAFATWADHARFARRARLVVANVLERWRRRAVVGAFDAWRDAAAEDSCHVDFEPLPPLSLKGHDSAFAAFFTSSSG